MPAHAPLKFTLYDPDTSEVIADYVCNFISVRHLKLAIRLSKSVASINQDALAGLIVELFGNKFSIGDLWSCSGVDDRMIVLQEVITRAGSFISKSSNIEHPSELEIISKEPDDEQWLEDLEIFLVQLFGWTIFDIDNTDIESLFPFMKRLVESRHELPAEKQVHIDQINWL